MGIRLGTKQKTRDVQLLATSVTEAILQAYLLGPIGISNALSALFRSFEATRGTDTVETKAMALVEESIAYSIAFLLGSSPTGKKFEKSEIHEFISQTLNKIRVVCQQQDVSLTSAVFASPNTFLPFKIAAEDTVYRFRTGLSGVSGK
jgi:hypothetical protein